MRSIAASLIALVSCADLRAVAIVGPLEAPDRAEPGRPIELTASDGVKLHGFLVAPAHPRGTVVLFHGMGDRASFWSAEAIALRDAGYVAVALDGRGHGRSGGLCTYGAHERADLPLLLDALAAAHQLVAPVILYGFSMGAGVAIQAAVIEPRVSGVLAIAPFATLEGVIDRVAWGAPRAMMAPVIAEAERRADFRIAAVRPIDAARALRVPLIAVAGTLDSRSPVAEVRRIAESAGGGAELLVVPGATHDEVLPRCGPPCGFALRRLLETRPDSAAPKKTGRAIAPPVEKPALSDAAF